MQHLSFLLLTVIPSAGLVFGGPLHLDVTAHWHQRRASIELQSHRDVIYTTKVSLGESGSSMAVYDAQLDTGR